MYRIANRDRFLIGNQSLVGISDSGEFISGLGYQVRGSAEINTMLPHQGLGDVPATIDTLAQDAAAVIQATTNPNQAPSYAGAPIFPVSAQTGITVGTALALGVGIYILARVLSR